MPCIVQLSGAHGQRRVTFTLEDGLADRPAADFVFDVLGTEDLEGLVEDGVVADSDLADLRELQRLVFDHDADGSFIRDGVAFRVGGRDLNPDAPLAKALTRVDQPGASYARCDMEVRSPLDAARPAAAAAPPVAATEPVDQATQVREFALIFLLHELSIGYPLDVTKDHVDLVDLLAEAEGRVPPLIEIDVAKAVYALSAAGKKYYQRQIETAQDLVKRFDIYGDVEIDAAGNARFDSGLGEDFRVAAFELAGVDPFKARFMLGLNDGDWDDLADWRVKCQDAEWYQSIFAPIEAAPSVDDIGRERLQRVVDQARNAVREDGALS